MVDVCLAINDTAPILDVAAELLGEQLPTTIHATQETLTSVATSAQLVDDLLGMISVIPLLGTDRYNPDVSLHQGFQDVSDGLDGIPELLLTAGEGLSAGTESLQGVEKGFAAMAQSISETMTSLESAQTVLQGLPANTRRLARYAVLGKRISARVVAGAPLGVHPGADLARSRTDGLVTQGWELLGAAVRPRGCNAAGDR